MTSYVRCDIDSLADFLNTMIEFLGSFVGTLLALYIFTHLQSRDDPQSILNKFSRSRPLQRLAKKVKPVKGTVLKSPTPEEERTRKNKEWEEKVYSRRQKEKVIGL